MHVETEVFVLKSFNWSWKAEPLLWRSSFVADSINTLMPEVSARPSRPPVIPRRSSDQPQTSEKTTGRDQSRSGDLKSAVSVPNFPLMSHV